MSALRNRVPTAQMIANLNRHLTLGSIDSNEFRLLPVGKLLTRAGSKMVIEAQELRRVMGHFATGVAVITTKDQDGAPQGLTANAFMSLSLNPPLVLISVDKGATCYGCFEPNNGFTVNFLSEDQEEISRRFATKGVDKFADLKWQAGSNGAAVIDGALGSVECKITNCYDGGDHTIVVGEILNVAGNGERPLLFFKGKYQRLPAS